MENLARDLFFVLVIAILIAAVGALNCVVYYIFSGRPFLEMLQIVASFGSFGILFGGIYMFDGEHLSRDNGAPIVRICIGATAGGCLATIWQWSSEAYFVSIALSSLLGYFGMTWARYVDF